jgi:hypothetical protein
MTRIKVKMRVGPDGILRLAVPFGKEEADREVELTIEQTSPTSSEQDYQEFLRSTAGAWQGEFERPPQGEYEHRDSLA